MKKLSLLFFGLAISFLCSFAQDENPPIIKVHPPLVVELPEAGLIDNEQEIADMEAVEWTLSNGVHVILKPTTFHEDEIQMSGFSWGGLSVLDKLNPETVKSLNDLIKISGIGHWSNASLSTALQGKTASITPFLDQTTDNIKGHCNINGIETMLQMVYLYFAEKSLDKEAFQQYCADLKTKLEQRPPCEGTFADSVCSVFYRNNPLKTPLKPSDIKKIDYEQGMAAVKDRFSDIDNFTFIFVGDFQLEDIRPFIELYLGSLPPSHRKEYWKHNDDLVVARKQITRDYNCKMANQEVSATLMYAGKMPYSTSGAITMEFIKEFLLTTYAEKLKKKVPEDAISIDASLCKFPHEIYMLQISFNTTPDLKKEVLNTVTSTLEEWATTAPSGKELDRIKKGNLRNHQSHLNNNAYWADMIGEYVKYSFNPIPVYEKVVEAITPATIQSWAQQLTQQGKLVVIQNPK